MEGEKGISFSAHPMVAILLIRIIRNIQDHAQQIICGKKGSLDMKIMVHSAPVQLL